ncbi:hypothetical protein ES702_05336 [subsurface metagenome]
MSRSHVEERLRVLREERMMIMEMGFERCDVKMRGKSVGERLAFLLYNDGHTDAERRCLEKIDAKIHGLRHILDTGFFA